MEVNYIVSGRYYDILASIIAQFLTSRSIPCLSRSGLLSRSLTSRMRGGTTAPRLRPRGKNSINGGPLLWMFTTRDIIPVRCLYSPFGYDLWCPWGHCLQGYHTSWQVSSPMATCARMSEVQYNHSYRSLNDYVTSWGYVLGYGVVAVVVVVVGGGGGWWWWVVVVVGGGWWVWVVVLTIKKEAVILKQVVKWEIIC